MSGMETMYAFVSSNVCVGPFDWIVGSYTWMSLSRLISFMFKVMFKVKCEDFIGIC